MTEFQGNDITNAEQLRNANTSEFLKEISKKVTPDLGEMYPNLAELKNQFYDKDNIEIPYNKNISYGDLYAKFLSELQISISDIEKDQSKKYRNLKILSTEEKKILADMNALIITLYANQNDALKRSAEFAHEALEEEKISVISKKSEGAIFHKSKGHAKGDTTKSKVSKELKYQFTMFSPNTGTSIEQQHPVIRFQATFLDATFQPSLMSNIASIRNYEHHKDKKNFKTEYRFCTQAEIINNTFRVNPLFPAWLTAVKRDAYLNAMETKTQYVPKINHIYFNNLGLDRTDKEGVRERGMTLELHGLEKQHDNIAVISLPADKGLMSHDILTKSGTSNVNDCKIKILNIVIPGSVLDKAAKDSEIKDFYISDNVKALLYGQARNSTEKYNKDNEKIIMNDLLNQAFAKMGIPENASLTQAQQQAIFFHFIKYEVTNFIIDRLNPESINFACKDAIDRGGVSSLYYNLVKSIETDHPMSQAEFFEALHGAPTMAKGRGINNQLDRVWNAVSMYVQANKENQQHPIPDWLIKLHNEHRDNFIKKMIAEYGYSKSLIGSTVTIGQDDYQRYTTGRAHKKLTDPEIAAVKARLSTEFIDELTLLSNNPDNLGKREMVARVDTLVNETLEKSLNARYQGTDKNNNPIYHKSGNFEEELKKILKITTYVEKVITENENKMTSSMRNI